MKKKDVLDRADIEDIIDRFYAAVLKDPFIGFIFTDIAVVNLENHLPLIVDFWADSLFKEQNYHSNTLQKHLDLHDKFPLKPGHFTRWLFLFNRAVKQKHQGKNAQQMIERAERVAASISAALLKTKRGDHRLSL